MSELSEEEIIKRLKNIIEINRSFLDCTIQENRNIYKDIQGLIELYQKEKELSLIRFKNLVKIQEEKIKIYNKGYFEGIKDERDNINEHIKEIIYPTPENPISLEMQSSEMYKKLLELLERN